MCVLDDICTELLTTGKLTFDSEDKNHFNFQMAVVTFTGEFNI